MQLVGQFTMDHPELQMSPVALQTKQLDVKWMAKDLKALLPKNPQVAFALPKSNYNPFFCDLEDKMFQASGVMFKFRLGSVQYVDALEGKTHFQALPNSQTTEMQMSVRRQ